MSLTAKQARFVEEYLVDLNATQAATRAGYSVRTAKEQGYELLSKPLVSEAIAAAQAVRAEKVGMTAQRVLEQLAAFAMADLADIYDDAGNLLPIKDWPLPFRMGLITGMDVEQLFEGRGEDREQIGRLLKPRTADRLKVWELIGKHVGVGAFKDKLELTGSLALIPTIIVNGKPS